jgi:hypothetical protein
MSFLLIVRTSQILFQIIALVWVISFLSALPYAFFTKLNYIHRPLNSSLPEDVLQDSAFCALLDENIYPQVGYQPIYCTRCSALYCDGYCTAPHNRAVMGSHRISCRKC